MLFVDVHTRICPVNPSHDLSIIWGQSLSAVRGTLVAFTNSQFNNDGTKPQTKMLLCMLMRRVHKLHCSDLHVYSC